MPQYKDFAIQKTAAESTDILLLQNPITGETYKITKGDFLAGLSSGGGSPTTILWTPANINCYHWLDISDNDAITLDENNRFIQSTDKSGSLFGFAQSDVNLRPVASVGLNNKRVLNFDGTNDYIRLQSAVNFGNNLDFYFVVKYSTTARVGLFDSAPGQPNVLRNNPNNYFEWWNEDPRLIINCAVNEFEIILFRYQLIASRTIALSLNDNAFTMASSGGNGSASWGQLTLGTMNTNQNPFNGSIAELVLTSSLNNSSRQKMFGYLANKWGMTDKLPANHPFKNSPPNV